MYGESRLKAYLDLVEARLPELLPDASFEPGELAEAMRYSALAPGKRIRPLFCMAACEACGGLAESALDLACAVEFVHCFSLVHDDLPSIDDDDLRRGRPTLHKVVGEGLALLAGDALFAQAFVVASRFPGAVSELSACALDLVAGETMDILSEGLPPSEDLVKKIHSRKTGRLFSTACRLGGLAARAPEPLQEGLAQFGLHIGLAFQVADDLLDETHSTEELGKAAGSDKPKGKMTLPAAVGLERAREFAATVRGQALRSLEALPGDVAPLQELARLTIERSR